MKASVNTRRTVSYIHIPKDGTDYRGVRFSPSSPLCVPIGEDGEWTGEEVSTDVYVVDGGKVLSGWNFEVTGGVSRTFDAILIPSGDHAILKLYAMGASQNSGTIEVTAYKSGEEDLIGAVQFVKGAKGMNGKDSLELVLDPPVITVPADSDGKADLTTARTSRAYVRRGGVNESGWSFEATGTGCTVRVTYGSGTVAIQSVTSENASVQVTALNSEGDSLTATLPVMVVKEGAKGKAGPFIPPPRFWDDYENGYGFKSGAEDENRLDCVYMDNGDGKVNAYRCVVSFTKSSSSKAPNQDLYNSQTSQGHWVAAYEQAVPLIATQVLLAQNAYIRLLSSNGVRIFNSDSKIVGQMSSIEGSPKAGNYILPFFIGGIMNEDGTFAEDPLFAVGEDGKLYSGGTTGNHIEINPNDRTLSIFDDSDAEVARHSGRKLSRDEVELSVSGTSGSVKDDVSFTTPATKQICSGTADGAGALKIMLPSYSFIANAGTLGTASPDDLSQIPFASCSLVLRIYVGGYEVKTLSIGSVGVTGTSSSQLTQDRFTSQAMEVSVSVPKGKSYRAVLEFRSQVVNATGASMSGSVSATTTGSVGYAYSKIGYWAEYGANGFFLSRGTANYIYVIFDDDEMLHFKVVCGGKTVIDSDTAGKNFMN